MTYLQTGIPDNVSYLVLGIVVLFTLLGGWLASFFWRLRNLRRDVIVLEQMEAEAAAVQSEGDDTAPRAPSYP